MTEGSSSPAVAAWERFYSAQSRPWGGAVVLPAVPRGARVLELGCGGGRLLLPLARVLGKEEERAGTSPMVGVDIARSSLLELAPKVPGVLVRSDAASLPFRDGRFGLVLCRHVLGHMMEEHRRRAASEILRVLWKGGTVHFEGFSVRDARYGKGRLVEPNTFLRGDGIIHHYFSAGEALELFTGASSALSREREWTERAGRGRMARASIEARIVK